MDKYLELINKLDLQLKEFFEAQADYIKCKEGCSFCCENGDYPISEIELRFLMLGYAQLDNSVKKQVQKNIAQIKKGEACPFLVQKKCSLYFYRPIICRVHGLAYFYSEKKAKVPYCANLGLNYSNVYNEGELLVEPISENLDSQNILKDLEYGEIRNLYDWIKS